MGKHAAAASRRRRRDLVASVVLALLLFAVVGAGLRYGVRGDADPRTAAADVRPGSPSATAGETDADRPKKRERRETTDRSADQDTRGGRDLGREAEQIAEASVGQPFTFGVASINILGSQFTRGKRGMGPGVSRAVTATRMLLGRDMSIIGFQELQEDQLNAFRRSAPGYATWPGTGQGYPGMPQTVAWDTSVFDFVSGSTIRIPYNGGQYRLVPVIQLEHVDSESRIWVMNLHNSPRGFEAERDAAMRTEIGKLRELLATDIPVVVTGDFNERDEALCRFTTETSLSSAVGGGIRGCRAPSNARIDWIFYDGLTLEGAADVTRAAPVPSITDHHVVFSEFTYE